MNQERPDPDQLLKRIQAEERESKQARLKIFFGPYPGVGKTFSMLEGARERKREGQDVVVGMVETHGRPETAALLEELEVLPRKAIPYKGITLHEFDLEAALSRKPDLILVDELAHTNPPGMVHAKRWQDIDELLRAGISVYTTMNVQHWESLNDVVAQITGVRVRETVPDTFLEKVHELELVDLPPADLLKRMSEGKVYIGDQAIRAAENFFQAGNLIALRELALRHTAERVDEQMQEFKSRYAIEKVLPVKERLLVGITAVPHSARLVRATLRLATSLRCDWITVYVQTPEHEKLPADQKARIIDTLRLAERLGGETAVLTGQDVAEEVLKYARSRNVTKIVLGKPSEPRWKELLFGSTVNEIARRSEDIDLYVINAKDVNGESTTAVTTEGTEKRKGIWQATLLVVLCTAMSHFLLLERLDRANLVMFYLLVVVWTAYRYGKWAGVYSSILSVLAFDFFLVPPYLTFAVSDTEFFITFAVMLFVALFISTLTGRLFSFADATRAREARLRSLYKVSRLLTEIQDQNEIVKAAARHIEEFFQSPVLILIADSTGALQVASGDRQSFGFSGNEIQTADWVYRHGELAGRGSDTLAGSKATYFPLKGRHKIMGVFGIRLQEEARLIEPEQVQLLETFASEIGEALESKELSESAGRATASMEAERLKNLVLRSFSYDVAGPAQEISATVKQLSSLTDKYGPSFKKAFGVLTQKSDQITRVVARLAALMENVFPTSEDIKKRITESASFKPSLAAYLLPGRIFFFASQATTKEILRTLVYSLGVSDPSGTLRDVEEREEAGGILVRPNVSIPHATVDGISGVIAALGIQSGNKGEDKDAHFWLLFVSGSESMKDHLQFLRTVSLTLTDDVLDQLAHTDNPDQAHSVIERSRPAVNPIEA